MRAVHRFGRIDKLNGLDQHTLMITDAPYWVPGMLEAKLESEIDTVKIICFARAPFRSIYYLKVKKPRETIKKSAHSRTLNKMQLYRTTIGI